MKEVSINDNHFTEALLILYFCKEEYIEKCKYDAIQVNLKSNLSAF